MQVLFLDESGDHNLSVIDGSYPLFVLGGIIVDQAYAANPMEDAVRAFKRNLFDRDDLVLHTADITRNRNGFERLKERVFRERFYRELNSLLRGLRFQVVACAIRKEDHLARYGVAALDPYMLSLDVLVERFCMEIGEREGGGVIVAEKRDPTLDRQLEIAWLNLKVQGTRYIRASTIEHRIAGLNLRSKSANIAALQLADLVLTPIGRKILGKPVKEDYRVIEEKFRRSPNGRVDGYGLVVLPK
ncbi:MAG TPA: DUF3800 domain-containing protein [Casimicrobiaceae bacterium]|nr:DUF3800 domain-containing protein [Sphingomicrobium sp.]